MHATTSTLQYCIAIKSTRAGVLIAGICGMMLQVIFDALRLIFFSSCIVTGIESEQVLHAGLLSITDHLERVIDDEHIFVRPLNPYEGDNRSLTTYGPFCQFCLWA